SGLPYQVVARLQDTDALRLKLASLTGFTVNLAWVKKKYFPEIISQVSQIGASGARLDFAVLDEANRQVAGVTTAGIGVMRTFPLQFFDSSLVEPSAASGQPRRLWTVQVSGANDPTFVWATRDQNWTLAVVSGTVLALAISFSLAARTVRARGRIAAMRADF